MGLPEKKVKKLIANMNSTTEVKIPAMKPIIECFEMGMDEKMLDYLITLGTEKYTKEELIKVYKTMFGSEEGWDEFWAEIYEMSFLVPEPDGVHYIIASIFPGWIELSVSGPLNPKRKAILNKFMDFWQLLKTINIPPVRFITNIQGKKEAETKNPHMGTLISRGSKEVSLNQPLTSEHQVRVKGEVFQLLKAHENEIAVMNCFCRQYKEMNGNGSCEHGLPVEGCISLGAISRQLVDNGVAKHLTYDEACDLMEEFERKGCIHTTFHYGSDTDNEELVICNCCTDCCLLYGGYLDGYISKIFIKSYYSPKELDYGKCIGCNKCGKACPTGATFFDKKNKQLVFNYADCVGCGQCVTQCPVDGVREMVRDERNVFVTTKPKKQIKAAKGK